MSVVKEIRPTVPTGRERALASTVTSQLMKILQSSGSNRAEEIQLIAESDDNHSQIKLAVPVTALKLFFDLLSEMAKGSAVTILPYKAELTSQQAAELLNVSRPFLVNLLEEGKIPYRKVGKHRRVRVQDILQFKEDIDTRRRETLDQLAQESQELDLS